jgi:hypothetical protein
MNISPNEARSSLDAIETIREQTHSYLLERSMIILLTVNGVAAGLLAMGVLILPPHATTFFSALVYTVAYFGLFALFYRRDMRIGETPTFNIVKYQLLSIAIPTLLVWGVLHYGRILLHLGADQANYIELLFIGLAFGYLGFRRHQHGPIKVGLICSGSGVLAQTFHLFGSTIPYQAVLSAALLTSAAVLARTNWSRAL